MWNPNDAAADLIEAHSAWMPTEEELEELFQELLLIELVEAEVGAALDALLATHDNACVA